MVEARRKFRIRTAETHRVIFKQIAFLGLGNILDISQSGMRIKTADKIEPGAVKLQVRFPFMKNIITVHGAVVWVDEEKSYCGVEFHYLNTHQNETIRKFQLLQCVPEFLN